MSCIIKISGGEGNKQFMETVRNSILIENGIQVWDSKSKGSEDTIYAVSNYGEGDLGELKKKINKLPLKPEYGKVEILKEYDSPNQAAARLNYDF
jgi:hypothetical protein